MTDEGLPTVWALDRRCSTQKRIVIEFVFVPKRVAMAKEPVLIIGAGHAGVEVAASLREEGYEEDIVILSDECDLPYQRPQLSKAFLKVDDTACLPLRAEQFFVDNRLDLRLGQTAVGIDRRNSRVHLSSGRGLDYSHLVIACGAKPRPFEVVGERVEGIAILRRLADARSLRQQLHSAQNVVVIGAGFIGLEIAATAAGLGKHVTIVEIGERVMGRAVSKITSTFFGQAHVGFGARLLLNKAVARFRTHLGKMSEVELLDNVCIPADLVVVGVGILPDDGLAANAGLDCLNGIAVNENLEASDPSISAIGDCAAFPSHLVNMSIRLESVQNAVDQARCVAGRLVGKKAPYRSLPWFWSDQGDLKLQIAGLSQGVDQWVLRGDQETRSFGAFGFRGGDLVVVETVNRPSDHMAARKLLEIGARISPGEAADLGFDLRRLALARA
jgi:3-phenylpropionate/trans-cinnamate dioxygenase ferredoxin reductase component